MPWRLYRRVRDDPVLGSYLAVVDAYLAAGDGADGRLVGGLRAVCAGDLIDRALDRREYRPRQAVDAVDLLVSHLLDPPRTLRRTQRRP